MKYYELTYIISPKLTEPEAQKFSEEIIDWIKKEGGILSEAHNPLKRRLAYQIKKEDEGFLTSLGFYFNPEKLINLTEKVKSETKILRSLIITKEPTKKTESPKILETKKEEKVAIEDIEKKLEEILGE
ncbi:30S ribosomal protein S6 [Patescibacteria group bacterium]|nr:30S ribosomal protein S6 [Patescibacteria group bacterium]